MFVRDICAGDVVLLREGVRVTARGVQLGEIGEERKPVAYLFDTDGRQWSLHPGDIVELVRRPWPEGKTAQTMGWAITRAAEAVLRGEPGPDMVRRLAELREALDAYELGIPDPADKPQGQGDNAGIR